MKSLYVKFVKSNSYFRIDENNPLIELFISVINYEYKNLFNGFIKLEPKDMEKFVTLIKLQSKQIAQISSIKFPWRDLPIENISSVRNNLNRRNPSENILYKLLIIIKNADYEYNNEGLIIICDISDLTENDSNLLNTLKREENGLMYSTNDQGFIVELLGSKQRHTGLENKIHVDEVVKLAQMGFIKEVATDNKKIIFPTLRTTYLEL